MIKVRLLSILAFLLVAFNVTAQDKTEQFNKLVKEGIELMDSGKYDEAIAVLKKSKGLTDKDLVVDYEIALAHYQKKDYKTAIKQLRNILKKDKSNFQVYQILGNAYDMNSQSAKAIETYEEGMKRFPKVGHFYLEKAVVLMSQDKMQEALKVLEKGVAVAPNYPSNYYHLAKIFYGTEEEIWGLLYGEIFMNLERNSKRTVEISELMYDLYKKSFIIDNDTSGSISMTKRNIVLDIKDIENIGKGKPMMPFENSYEMAFAPGALMPKEKPISSVVNARETFFTFWTKEKMKQFPNALISFQKKIRDAGHFEAYSHWILLKGDEDQFNTWLDKNEAKWKSFMDWFGKNKISIDKQDKYYRLQY